jgi:hypothetical protein
VIWLRALSALLLAAGVAVRRTERRVVARFADAGANTPPRAIHPEDGGPLLNFVHARLERAGVLKRAVDDRYYFEAAAYLTYRRHRRRRALALIATALGAAVLLSYTGVLR